MPPPLADAFGRVRAVSWNSVGLFGGLASNPRRWRAKRGMVEKLCSDHDIVLFQETRGKSADVLTLPSGFFWTGSFFRASDFDASSRAGGVVVGVRRAMGGAMTARTIEISRGRCIVVQLRDWCAALHIINVHLDPAMATGARINFLHSIRDFISNGVARPTFVGGDWICLVHDESRLDIERGERRDNSRVSAAFDAMFGDMTECAQENYTFSRVFSVGENAVYSRLDRWYTNLDPQALGRVVMSVAVVGLLLVECRPSDHLLVSVFVCPTGQAFASPAVVASRRRP